MKTKKPENMFLQTSTLQCEVAKIFKKKIKNYFKL